MNKRSLGPIVLVGSLVLNIIMGLVFQAERAAHRKQVYGLMIRLADARDLIAYLPSATEEPSDNTHRP